MMQVLLLLFPFHPEDSEAQEVNFSRLHSLQTAVLGFEPRHAGPTSVF